MCMIKTPTVFILGAGASCPYGYPSSAELTRSICERVLKASAHQGYMEQHFNRISGTEFEQFKQIAENLQRLRVMSIDRFLEINQNFQRAGKLLIAQEILSRETPNIAPLEDDWHSELWTEYLCTRRLDELVHNRVTFVTFNYDRSLEYFLFQKMKSTFPGENDGRISSIANTLEIIHVHGQVGFLPWQTNCDSNYVRGYARDDSWETARKFSEQIKIISEIGPMTEGYGMACRAMYEADHIYFLGFGYHEENLKRLASLNADMRLKDVRGSCFRLPERDLLYLQSDANPLRQPIVLGNGSDTVLSYLRRSVMRD